MKEVEVKFAELHSPLFLGGMNFGLKLDTAKRPDMKLWLATLENQLVLVVQYKEHTTVVQSFSHAQPVNSTEIGFEPLLKLAKPTPPVKQTHHPMKTGIASAQVSTPQDHVFKGRQ